MLIIVSLLGIVAYIDQVIKGQVVTMQLSDAWSRSNELAYKNTANLVHCFNDTSVLPYCAPIELNMVYQKFARLHGLL